MEKNTEQTKISDEEKLLQLSVSSVETFQSCKAKWYYRYILKLPATKNYHTTAGSFIHKVLEVFLQQLQKYNNIKRASQIALAVAKKDEELIETLTPEIVKEGEEWLQLLIDKFEKEPGSIPNVVRVEAPFVFKLEEDNILVRGFIDRIDQIDEKTLGVIDYKTSSKPAYLKSFQLATYSVATKKNYPGMQVKVAYQLIRHNFEKQEHLISEADELNVLRTFKEVAKEIRALKLLKPNEVWEASPSKLCDYCPYRVRCETDRSKKSPWKV